MKNASIITVTPDNMEKEGIFCLKNPKHPGYQRKVAWYRERYREGLRLKLLKDETGAMAGFIEYVPAEYAWRPVSAPEYLFIHCIWVYPKKMQGQGFGSQLIETVMEDAGKLRKKGVAVMCSEGPWMSSADLYLRNGFTEVDRRERFQLLVRKLDPAAPEPELIDWTKERPHYQGWHLLYANQCPMHEKSAGDLLDEAMKQGIDLKVTELHTPSEAQRAPSGYGLYNLIHNGEVLQDHYVSRTRFRNILKQVKFSK